MKLLCLTNWKITSIIITLLIGLIIISCEKPMQKNPDSVSKVDIEYMKKNHIITLKSATKMYNKYTKERVKILKDTLKKKYGTNFSDTRTVWFDIKTIKAYLKYLENNASEAEGLQFYFSVDLGDKGKQGNHQTFFIAPTVKNVINGDTIQSGYTIENGKKVFLYNAFKKYIERSEATMQKASFFIMPPDDGGLLLNDGDLNPPGGNN